MSIEAQVLQEVHARLLTPIASYSEAGQNFDVQIGAPLQFGSESILPQGTILQGRVRVARGVGVGLRRERAELEIEFQRCNLPSPQGAGCTVEMIEIDNAREQVTHGNRIHGIRAASNPNALLQGIWLRPASTFLQRSSTVLAGPTGAIQNRLAPSPLGVAIAIASRLTLFSLPNTEIELPAGTGLVLRVKATGTVTPVAAALPPPAVFAEERKDFFEAIPSEIKNGSGNLVSDRINFVFRGTRAEIESAFAAAGWTTADPLNYRSFVRCYSAFTSLKGYAKAPVSPLFYQHGLPDFVFQKSFNTLAKRHHIRFWRVEDPDEESPLWVAAATHDIGIAFDWRRFSLTHRIDEHLDRERSKVLNDLSTAGCLSQLSLLDRPALAGEATDGKLAVAVTQPCNAELPYASGTLRKPRNPVYKRVARRFVLETRQYVMRGSAYYMAYRGVRKAVAGIRRPVDGISPANASGNGLR